jgi:hypothetical protein
VRWPGTQEAASELTFKWLRFVMPVVAAFAHSARLTRGFALHTITPVKWKLKDKPLRESL